MLYIQRSRLKYYIVLTNHAAKRIEQEHAAIEASARSDLSLLSQDLNASFIKPPALRITYLDKILGKLYSTPENWAYARYLSFRLRSNDVVFCPGEEIGIPLASIYATRRKKPKIVVWFHRITGLRTKIILKLFRVAHGVDLSVVNTRPNQKFLNSYLKIKSDRILFLWHPIDSKYFVPGLASSNKTKPIIASVGLERRDYRLLAAATAKLDVDVKVAGFSQFQSRIAKCFPPVMPENMSNKKYESDELIQLYHDADVVVLPLKENDGAAGITALLEAMSCKKPVVCVRTKGLADCLDETAVTIVEPGDVSGLQQAIVDLLGDRDLANAKAQRAYELVRQKHDLDNAVKILGNFVRTLEE